MDQGFSYYGVVTFINFLIIMQSDGRYLRPSDHGLAFQNSSIPTKGDVPEMLSFFNGGRTASFQSDANVPLPEARNLSSSTGNLPATWWSRGRRSRDGGGKDRLREVLLIVSLVCGLTGVVLLVISASVFIFRYRKQKQQKKNLPEGENQSTFPSPAPSTSSLALVSTVTDNSSTK